MTVRLAEELAAALAACVAAYPEFAVDQEGFAQHLGARACGEVTISTEPALLDLYVAYATAHGDPRALAVFERDVLPAASAGLRALRVPAAAIDEALQRVRHRLLVAVEDHHARLLDYRGEGRLRAWVRVVAVREHLMELRGQRTEVPLSDAVIATVPDPADDPAMTILRHHYRTELAAAVATALATLDARERTLLRYSLIDGLDLSAIGTIYHTHKSTISRWLARARARLWQATRAALTCPGGIDSVEVESLIRAVRSGLDLSLERLLATE